MGLRTHGIKSRDTTEIQPNMGYLVLTSLNSNHVKVSTKIIKNEVSSKCFSSFFTPRIEFASRFVLKPAKYQTSMEPESFALRHSAIMF